VSGMVWLGQLNHGITEREHMLTVPHLCATE